MRYAINSKQNGPLSDPLLHSLDAHGDVTGWIHLGMYPTAQLAEDAKFKHIYQRCKPSDEEFAYQITEPTRNRTKEQIMFKLRSF